MTIEYEMCEHGRHVGAVCLPCAEKEMIYDREPGVIEYVDPYDGELMSDDIVGDADQKYFTVQQEYVDPFDMKPEHVDEKPYTGRNLSRRLWDLYEETGNYAAKKAALLLEEHGDTEVHSPKHYTVGGYEAIDVIRAKLTPEEYIGGLKWQILKYTMRANYKGHHDQDCEKATWYANELVDFLQKQRNVKSVDMKD